MADLTEIEKFAKNNDSDGFKAFLEKIYLRAGFSALLSLKNELKEEESDFYSKAIQIWLDTFCTFISETSSSKGLCTFANALIFCINETKEPLELILKNKSNYSAVFTELLRRTLFSFLRNTPPGEKRLRPRKALLILGYAGVRQEEDAFTPLIWTIYAAIYKLEISGDIDEFKNLLNTFINDASNHDIIYLPKLITYFSELTTLELYNFVSENPEPRWNQFTEKLKSRLTIFEEKKQVKNLPELEVVYLKAPELIKIKIDEPPPPEPAETLDEMELLLRSLSDDYSDKKLYKLVDIVKNTNQDDYDRLYLYLQENGENFALKNEFRRELKILMADGDMPESVSEKAIELLPYLGTSSVTRRTGFAELTKLYEDDEDDAPPPPTIFAPQKTLSLKDDLRIDFPPEIIKYLEMSGSPETLKQHCLSLLKQADENFIDIYARIFDFHFLKSGRILFDKITCAGKALLEHKGKSSKYTDIIKSALSYIFYYKDCSDIIKMEAFELLNRSGYFDFQTADNIKRYALSFAKDSLSRYSQGVVCKSLADLISIKLPASSRNVFEGKSFNKLMSEFIPIVMKEQKVKDRAYDLLNHLTFEDPLRLRILSDKIQPVNYKEAVEVVAQLLMRHNRWAGLILVETAGQDFTDIRDAAVLALGKAGQFLSTDLKERAIKLIVEKADECYDDDMRKLYLDTAVKVDPEKFAAYLIGKCTNSGLNDRKEFGNLLLASLKAMPADIFLNFFEKGTNLEGIHRFLKTAVKDAFIMDFAGRFVEIYRANFLIQNDESDWGKLFHSKDRNRMASIIDDIWSLRGTAKQR